MNETIHEDLIKRVEAGVARSLKWAETGWRVTFGRDGVVVSSLTQARVLPEHFIYREEALDYWHNIEQLGRDAAAYGEKAIRCLEKNDVKRAEDFIYQACYIERPCEQYSATWKTLHELVCQRALLTKENPTAL